MCVCVCVCVYIYFIVVYLYSCLLLSILVWQCQSCFDPQDSLLRVTHEICMYLASKNKTDITTWNSVNPSLC